MVGPSPGNPGIDDGDEAWIAKNNQDFKLTREALGGRKKGSCNQNLPLQAGYFAGKGARGADTSETPLSAVNVTSVFYHDFYFGKGTSRKGRNIFGSPGACQGGGSQAWGEKAGRRPWQDQVCSFQWLGHRATLKVCLPTMGIPFTPSHPSA